MADDRSTPPSKADQYRKRVESLGKSLKSRISADRAKMEKKQKALNDMAENEDWLDGKPGSQLKK